MIDKIIHSMIVGLLLALAVMLADAHAMEQATAIEEQANAISRMLTAYGWPLLAFLSPLASWRLVQAYKLAHKRKYSEKPEAWKMDIVGWLLVFTFCFYAWFKHTADLESAAFIALLVAIFHTAIVKAIFHYAPEKVTEILQYGGTDMTVTMFAGRDSRAKSRDEDITQPRK